MSTTLCPNPVPAVTPSTLYLPRRLFGRRNPGVAARLRARAARLKAQGRALLEDRTRSAQARAPLEKAVKLTPNDPEAHYYLARWACLHNADRLCLAEAGTALRLAPGNDDASLQLNTLAGIAAEKLGQPETAEKAFAAALSSNRKLGSKTRAAYQYLDFLLKRARDDDAQPLSLSCSWTSLLLWTRVP